MLTAILIIAIVLLLVVVIILLNRAPIVQEVPNTFDNNGTNIITTSNNKLNIISQVDNNGLQEYCGSWAYNYNCTGVNYVNCFLHEKAMKPDMNQSMNLLLQLVASCGYIAFNDTTSYLTNSSFSSFSSFTSFSSFSRAEIDKELLDIELSVKTVNKILDSGYPCLTKSGMLLSRAYLYHIFKSEPLPFVVPCYIPSVIAARAKASKSKIPKIIHQTFETPLISQSLHNAIHTWLIRNPEYEVRYYTDRDRREYIKKYFDASVLIAYDKLIPGAYRADLWRYCVIYNEGGIYADIKLGPLVPLSSIINDNTELVVVNDDQVGALYNAFFAAIPKHKTLYDAIMLAVKRVLNDEYGNHCVYPTGPAVLGAIILPYYNMKDRMGTVNNVATLNVIYEDNKWYIKDMTGKRLIAVKHSSNITEANAEIITGRPHHSRLWSDKQIYRY